MRGFVVVVWSQLCIDSANISPLSDSPESPSITQPVVRVHVEQMIKTVPVPSCAGRTVEAEAVLTWMTAVLSYANVRRHKAPHHQPYASTRGITTSWSITITSHRRGTCQRGAAQPPRTDFITLSRTSANQQFNWSCTVTDHLRHIGTITTSAITPATAAASITFTINFIVLIVISLKIPNH